MRNIAIYIYDDAEVLDFSGPFEVFSTANRLCSPPPFNVFLIAEQLSKVIARGGYPLLPHYDISNHPAIDVLVVVGGEHDRQLTNGPVIDWIRQQAAKVPLVASVCTGAFLLAAAGVLANRRVTTHWQDIAALAEQYPETTVLDGVRWVDEGDLITSAGISAGIDMSLYLVSRLIDMALAVKTARQMEYDWQGRGVVQESPVEVLSHSEH